MPCCSSCQTQTNKKCAGCSKGLPTYFCSTECQKLGWKQHKKRCGQISSALNRAKTDNALKNILPLLEQVDCEGELREACNLGLVSLATFILDIGYDVNSIEKSTPLHFFPLFIACQEGRVELARVLLDRGAKVNMIVSDGQSSLVGTIG
jgi:hypothetical protein